MGLESVHLRELAVEIGPRPAGTDAEARAADYLETVFIARGLEVDRQEFSTPRTYSWAFVIYHTLTLASAVAVGFEILRWPAVALSLVVAVVMWLDLDTRWGLSNLLPKAPSQNVVAKHVPRSHRGERTRRVIVVAHYDSARSSLAFSPGMVKNFELTFTLMKAITFGAPLVILVSALPFTAPAQPWLWYFTLAFSAFLVVPLFINVHRELFMRFTDGAGDNASGVAAMLGVMDRIVPVAETFDRPEAQPVRRGEDEAWAADVVPDGATLTYAAGSGAPREHVPEDDWGDIDGPAPMPSAPMGTGSFEATTNVFEAVTPDARGARTPAAPVSASATSYAESLAAAPAAPAPADGFVSAEAAPASAPAVPVDSAPQGTGGQDRGVADWLGLGRGFDARKKGREIGSWDNFGDEADDDDGIGWKGGSAPGDDIDDPEFAATEAARIRRMVLERPDRELVEKEVWFVATGAEEVGTFGMQAFLSAHKEEASDAVIINIDNVGSGSVHYVTSEGMARRYHCDRRLASAAKRIAREDELPIKAKDYRGLSTDATPALARGFRAMSVMAFDINGRIPNWHWKTDTVETCSEETMDQAADFVAKLIRGL